jgi:hypothetical protein
MKNPSENLLDDEDKLPVGNLLEDICTQPLTEFYHPLLMAGWADNEGAYRERQASTHGRSSYI